MEEKLLCYGKQASRYLLESFLMFLQNKFLSCCNVVMPPVFVLRLVNHVCFSLTYLLCVHNFVFPHDQCCLKLCNWMRFFHQFSLLLSVTFYCGFFSPFLKKRNPECKRIQSSGVPWHVSLVKTQGIHFSNHVMCIYRSKKKTVLHVYNTSLPRILPCSKLPKGIFLFYWLGTT